jgi:mannosyltransferase
MLVGLAILGAVPAQRHHPDGAAPVRSTTPGTPRPDRSPEPGATARDRAAGLLGLAILLPVALLFLAGRFTELWVPRYLVTLVPFVCLLAASALAPLRLRVALPVVAVVCLLGAPTQAHIRHTHEWPRDQPVDYRRAAAVITANRQPDDGIVFSPRDRWAYLDTAASYYLGRSLPRDVLRAEDPVRRAAFWATECDRPAECLAGVNRIWLLARGERDNPFTRMPPAKRQALRDGYAIQGSWTVPGLTVVLLTRRG